MGTRWRAVLLLSVLLASPAWAWALTCPGGIRVSGGAADARQVCRALRAAAPFLREIGLALPRGVHVRLVGQLAETDGGSPELGRYDGREHAILMLAFAPAQALARRLEPGFGVAMDRALWRSYVVHEITHAAIHAGCGRDCPDRALHEYIAAVAQLATLPAAQRARILAAFPGVAGFADVAEISEIYYALSPCQFAVKSYLHYRRPGHGAAFVRRLLKPGAG